jgi:all-trans-retinol dehydrogenase (NAD+)
MYKVIIWDIDEKGLKQTTELTQEKCPGAEVFPYVVNLTSRESIYALAEQVQKEHGFVWGLINNAGILAGASLLETPDKKIEMTMNVNIMAHFWTVKAFLPAMMEKNDGHIVGVSSAAGFFPSARMTEYCTSKFAARGFMEALRIELSALGKTGVKATLVAPAHINTALFQGYSMGSTMQPEWVAEQIVHGMRINKAILFLPWYVSLGNLWQGIFPTFIWDLFMMPTNSQLSNWDPSQANKVFDKMDAKQ